MRASPGTPNHPLVKAIQNDWPKIAALIMGKLGLAHVEITVEEIARLTVPDDKEMPTLLVQVKANALHIRLMPMREAKAFAALHESGDV